MSTTIQVPKEIFTVVTAGYRVVQADRTLTNARSGAIKARVPYMSDIRVLGVKTLMEALLEHPGESTAQAFKGALEKRAEIQKASKADPAVKAASDKLAKANAEFKASIQGLTSAYENKTVKELLK